jgi:hypothetical protein
MSQRNAFDFLVGSWDVHHRYLRRRLAGCHDWIEFPGSCSMRKILDGLANIDDGDIHLPSGRYVGASLRTYDPARDAWSIYWLDSRYPGQIFPPVHGRFVDGVGTFDGEDSHDGRAIRVRFLWSRITPASARWEQAFAPIDGGDWETNWIMDFTRAA